MAMASDYWSLFPDYMWMQFAMSWGIDTSSWHDQKLDKEVLDLGYYYFTTRSQKHNMITDNLVNNHKWLRGNVFDDLSPEEWESKYLRSS